MAKVTPEGVQRTSLSEYKAGLEEIFKTAFGDDLVLEPDTPQGTAIGLLALRLSEADEAILGVGNSLSIFDAIGQQIDGLTSILAIARNGDEPSLVGVVITGVPGTVVPAGSLARSTDGDMFMLRSAVVIPASGTVSGIMESVEGGPIPCKAHHITAIVSGVTGWETLDNPEDGQLGKLKETDFVFRRGYFRKLFKNATTPLNSIVGEVLDQEGVLEAVGEENDTKEPKTVRQVELPPNSTAIVVLGGVDEDIAKAIQLKKTGGGPTTGDVSIPVKTYRTDGREGPTIHINFYRAVEVGLEIDLDIAPGPTFPTDGVSLLKKRIQAYFAGTLELQLKQDEFEMDGLLIGEPAARSRLYTPINSVPGHTVNSLNLRRKGGVNEEMVAMTMIEKAVILNSDDITITINGA